MAAGQGFKTFTTGEVLTAGDVNGYLMQGINVFTNTTARDAAITAPAEGQFAFTKDTNSLWYYDGAAWVASGAAGDIEGVTAGVGISGGGTSGTVTVTNSMATAIDAKGDLVPGTGADTFARLAVGANDTVLTADSSTATGLKWATPASTTPTFVGCTASGVPSIPNGAYTAFAMASEEIDTDAFHSTTTNTSRMTIPSGKAGKYLFIFYASYPTAASIKAQRVYKNGALLQTGAGSNYDFRLNDTIGATIQSSFILDLAVNDYIEMYVYQDSGAATNMGGYVHLQYLGA